MVYGSTHGAAQHHRSWELQRADSLSRSRVGHEHSRQITELISVQVGNQPEAHAILREVTEIESIAHRFRGRGLASRRPNEYVDQVLSAPVHEHRNALAVNHIDTPSKKVEPAS